MIQLFDLQDGDLKPTVHCWAITWLKDIMTQFPECYIDIYRYIFYMTCPDQDLNVYVNTPEIDKSEVIMRMLYPQGDPKFWPEDSKVDKAIEESRKLYATPTNEVYMAGKSMLEKLKRSFQTEELTWGGKDATGPALTAAMEKLPKLIQAFADSELKLNQELKSRSRGNQMVSWDIDELNE